MPTIGIGTNPDARLREIQALDALDDLMQFTTDIEQHEITQQLHDIYCLMETKMKHLNFVSAATAMAHLKLVK